MHSITSRIIDQAARARRVCVLAFMSGFLMCLHHPGYVGPLPAGLFAGLLYAGLITPAAVATAVLLPGLTRLSDAVQVSRLVFACAVALFPAVCRPLADQPVVNATLVILGGMAIMALARHAPRLASMPMWRATLRTRAVSLQG